MLGGAMYTTIKTLWEKNQNKSQISRLTGHDWKTVSKVIKDIESGIEYPAKKPHPRKLDPYQEKILKWIEEDLTGVRIYEKLTESGVKVGYSTVKNYIQNIKKNKNVFVRIHTEPGKESQVDFGYVGLTPGNDGKRHKTWVFNMRLSNSRYDYYEKVYNQRVETFIQCHINAFRYYGGVPETVKIDNLKAAILEANFYEPIYQQLYKSFAEYYSFKPLPCRIYRPNDKGKVEAGIKYVKQNFFAGRKFKDGNDVDRKLKDWLENKCNKRIHGTTRKIPFEVFNSIEKSKLKPLPILDFKMCKVGKRKVYHDCHIFIEYNYYSVPFEYVGKTVDIEIDKLVRIFYKNIEIAIHTKLEGRGKYSTNISHYPKYKVISETEYQEKYQVKMSKIGPFAEQLFFLLLKNNPYNWNRVIKGVLSLVKTYTENILEQACKRAVAYNVSQYRIIKNICENGTYNLPLEFDNEKEAL